jgi:hypothetical protein
LPWLPLYYTLKIAKELAQTGRQDTDIVNILENTAVEGCKVPLEAARLLTAINSDQSIN